jgi:ferredoxin/flavodoxin---NADP+ reductase
MIGLMGDNGRPLLRAYSIASPSWDEELEFYSIKVQDGPLTSKLQHIRPGDRIILKPKPVGTLVHDALLPGGGSGSSPPAPASPPSPRSCATPRPTRSSTR